MDTGYRLHGANSFRRISLKRLWHYFAAALAVIALYLGGHLESMEAGLMDLRFRVTQRPASGQIVLVEIDARSMQELRTWPWPRTYHARVLENLASAGAGQIALDVDFSARKPGAEDERLATALAAARRPVILPAFKQTVPSPAGVTQFVYSTPLPEFSSRARIAAVNVRPDRDGLIRRFDVGQQWKDGRLASLAAMLAGQPADSDETFYLDYGLDPATFTRLSYVDVMRGNFDARIVAGKSVLVGATAVELGDYLSVPVLRAIAGPLVQAIAFESLIQGRAIRRVGGWPLLIALLLLAPWLGVWFERMGWRRSLALLFGLVATGPGVTFAVQGMAPLSIDFVPAIVLMALCYIINIIRNIDRLDFRLLVQGIAIQKKDAFMQGVVEHSFDAIVTVDAGGAILSFNPAAERRFGYGAD